MAQLKTVLHQRGITIWSSNLIGRQGLEQPRKALREVVCAAQEVLLIVSPEARASRHVREALEVASMYRRTICAIWIEGENWQECLPAGGQDLSIAIDARAGDADPRLWEELVSRLQREWSEQEASRTTVPEKVENQVQALKPRNPYKGLQAFRQEDQRDFFGRDGLIDTLLCALADTFQTEGSGKPTTRLLAIMGPSGSGKSSVVMAGLLPRLRQGALPGSDAWIYLEPMVPGAHPLEALALALAGRLPDRSLLSIRQDLEEDSARGLHQLATTIRHGCCCVWTNSRNCSPKRARKQSGSSSWS